MGIRISRKIGYFLKASDCKKLLRKDYKDIIFEILYGENSDFYSEIVLNRLLGTPFYSDLIDSFDHQLFVQFLPKKPANDIISMLMSQVHMCDDYKGILFQTTSLNQENRHDTCLDYYDKPFKYECKILNRGIYPYDGMRTKQAITLKDREYTANQRVDFNQIKSDLFVSLKEKGWSNENIIQLMNHPIKLLKAIKETGLYYPEMASEIKWLIHSLEMNKEGVSTFDIIQHLEPAIITTWG